MIFDAFSVAVMTTLVVAVATTVFVVDTLIRRDEGAGRIWALGYLAATLTAVAYLVWDTSSSAWWALAVGNATFVAGTGCMWLGCRRFNRRPMAVTSGIVAGVVAVVAIVTLLAGPAGGAWAGAVPVFVALYAFAAAGSTESLRGAMGDSRASWGLTAVLAVQAVFYAIRTVVFFSAGPDSALFTTWFGSFTVSVLTVMLTIVAVVVTSVLRAGRASVRGRSVATMLADDGILSDTLFARMAGDLTARAEARGDLVGVISVRVEDLDQISTAFGSEVAGAVAEAWREGVRRYAPSAASVGEDGRAGLLVAVQPASAEEARRQAALIYRGLFEDLGAVTGAIIPVVGVGVALSDAIDYRVDELVRAARDAARRAATSVEASVLMGEA